MLSTKMKKSILKHTAIIFLSIVCVGGTSVQNNPLKLWYDKPVGVMIKGMTIQPVRSDHCYRLSLNTTKGKTYELAPAE